MVLPSASGEAAKRRCQNAITEEDHRRGARAVLIGREGVAAERGNAKQREESGRGLLGLQPFGLAGAGQGNGRVTRGGYGFEGTVLCAPVLKVQPRRTKHRELRHPLGQQTERGGIAKGQRT